MSEMKLKSLFCQTQLHLMSPQALNHYIRIVIYLNCEICSAKELEDILHLFMRNADLN